MNSLRLALLVLASLIGVSGCSREKPKAGAELPQGSNAKEKQRTPQPAQPTFSELSESDAARLERQRAVVLSAAKSKYGISAFAKDKTDLKLLQKLLDDHVFAKTQTYELQALGVVFGDILAKEFGLRWVIITDQFGTDPTLRFGETSLNINAPTMISKRLERGEPTVDVTELFEGISGQLKDLKNKVK